MAKIEKTNTNKNVVELRSEMNVNGVRMEHVYVDGKPFVCIGYASEADKQAALKVVQAAIDGSSCLMEAMVKLSTNAYLTDNNVDPDEEIEIGGIAYFISYGDKTLYDCSGEPVVDCKELTCDLPKEACKTILVQRAELKLADMDMDSD